MCKCLFVVTVKSTKVKVVFVGSRGHLSITNNSLSHLRENWDRISVMLETEPVDVMRDDRRGVGETGGVEQETLSSAPAPPPPENLYV